MKNVLFYTIVLSLAFLVCCKKPYEPAVLKSNNRFLVVEGVINAGANASTTILLSRTRNVYDTLPSDPELFARASIESEGGGVFPLQEQGNGVYISANQNLNAAGKYILKITTKDENQYLSDFVPVKQAPPIDSISWEQSLAGVNIFVNTHDPLNKTIYYRWEFLETWEYHSFFDSHLGFKNGQVYFLDSSELKNRCWSNSPSTEVLIANSLKLSEDIISLAPITSISRHDEKIIFRYSIQVKQYALTKEAFEHWQILEKNKKQRGSIFEGQPAQLTENIHCVTNPGERVIGWVSASTIHEKRIYIRNSEVAPWGRGPTGVACPVIYIDPSEAAAYMLRDPENTPAYFVTGGGLVITHKRCVDCRLNGNGIPVKPSFWQ